MTSGLRSPLPHYFDGVGPVTSRVGYRYPPARHCRRQSQRNPISRNWQADGLSRKAKFPRLTVRALRYFKDGDQGPSPPCRRLSALLPGSSIRRWHGLRPYEVQDGTESGPGRFGADRGPSAARRGIRCPVSSPGWLRCCAGVRGRRRQSERLLRIAGTCGGPAAAKRPLPGGEELGGEKNGDTDRPPSLNSIGPRQRRTKNDGTCPGQCWPRNGNRILLSQSRTRLAQVSSDPRVDRADCARLPASILDREPQSCSLPAHAHERGVELPG